MMAWIDAIPVERSEGIWSFGDRIKLLVFMLRSTACSDAHKGEEGLEVG